MTRRSSSTSTPIRVDILPPSVADPGAVFATGALAFESIDTQRLNSTSIYGQGTYHFSDPLRLTAACAATKNEQEGLVAVFFNPAVDLKTDFRALTGKAVLEYDVAAHSTLYGMWSSGIKPGGTAAQYVQDVRLKSKETFPAMPGAKDDKTIQLFDLSKTPPELRKIDLTEIDSMTSTAQWKHPAAVKKPTAAQMADIVAYIRYVATGTRQAVDPSDVQ